MGSVALYLFAGMGCDRPGGRPRLARFQLDIRLRFFVCEIGGSGVRPMIDALKLVCSWALSTWQAGLEKLMNARILAGVPFSAECTFLRTVALIRKRVME